jgi:signal transduction histidine kinase/DNA-binding NarL/FixJ family response regulator
MVPNGDLFLIFFTIGGLFTISLYCFLTYFSLGRDKLFFGYGIFTMASSLIIFNRRVLPLYLPGGGHPWPEALSLVFMNASVGIGLFFFLTFLKIGRRRLVFRVFLVSYILLTCVMLTALVLLLEGMGDRAFIVYYASIGVFTSMGLVYTVRTLVTRFQARPPSRSVIIYMGIIFAFLIALSGINAFFPRFAFTTVLFIHYPLLILFFFLHGSKNYRDYLELMELKTELEEKVRRRTAQIEDMREKEQRFYITITHETKTPLTLVSGCLARYMASAPPHQDLELMKRTLDALRTDLADHLEFEKLLIDAGHFDHDRTTDLAWFLREKTELFRSIALKNGISLESRTPETLPVSADPAAVDEILNNLLENAVKYTEYGGRIMAELRTKGRTAFLSIKDTGIGIPPDLQERVFDPYRQVSSVGRGARGIGMGLAIVKQIVDGLGGSISFRSPPREGEEDGGSEPWVTEIDVTFPGLIADKGRVSAADKAFAMSGPLDGIEPAPGRASADGDAAPPSAARDPDRPAVIIVEDNADLRRFLVSSLEGRYNAYGAAEGGEALAMMDAMPPPDVIVSDIMMEGMDGYGLLAALQASPRYRDLPFIFLTAISSPVERLKSLSGGAIDYITKPLASAAELEAKIASLIGLLKRRSERAKDDVFEKLTRAIQEERSGLPRQERDLKENAAAYGLTERELAIVECLGEGMQNKEISARLGTSTRTVDSHLYHIFKKTGSQNRVELLNKLLAPSERNR